MFFNMFIEISNLKSFEIMIWHHNMDIVKHSRMKDFKMFWSVDTVDPTDPTFTFHLIVSVITPSARTRQARHGRFTSLVLKTWLD